MQLPLPTGQVARLLGVTEPELAEAVRRGHVQPEPPVLAGRRLWEADHIRQAAEHLGRLTSGLEQQLAGPDEEVARV